MLITTFSCLFPMKITSADPPGNPTSENPVNNSMDISINTDLRWSCVDPDSGDVLLFDVFFGKTSSPEKISSNQSDFSYDPSPLDYDTTYYWRIVAWDKTNASTDGPLWNFTTVMQINQPPDAPNNPNPLNGSLGITIDPLLSWSCTDPNGDDLTFDVYFGMTGSPNKVTSNQSDSVYNPGSLNYGSSYYWKIIAWDVNGASNASQIWYFQTNNLPYPPNNPFPLNESANVSINSDMSWIGDDPDPGDIVSYDVYFGTASSPLIVSDNQSGLSYNPGTLNYNTLYYWRIVAWDDQGASTVGPLWRFTTGTEANRPPNIPINPSPADNYQGASIDVTLSWTGGDPDGDPVLYDVYFGSSNPPPKVGAGNESGISYDPEPLEYVTVYYWRIIAWDDSSESSAGPIWNFTTKSETNRPPNIPNSPSPRNGSTGVTVNTDISWLGGDPDPGDNVTYDVYFGISNPPTRKVQNQSATFYDAGTMNFSTTYYWIIVAWDSTRNSSTSPLFHFKTAAQSGGGQEPPLPPQNILPVADASARAPYQGYVNTMILFDGSLSHDPDGNITDWVWHFDNNSKTEGKTVYHSFSEPGTHVVTLTVTDERNGNDTDTTSCIIKQTNRAPTKPTIQGPPSGTKNTIYIYTAVSTDPDNDPLQYTFQWSGSIIESRSNIPSGENCSVNHSWNAAGRYNLTVTVADNQNVSSESSARLTIYIDAIQTRGAGYLLDNDGDGTYDAFYSDETHQTVSVQWNGESYLIDKNGDGTWEYVYNATYGLTSYQEPRKTPGFELVIFLGAITVTLVLWRKIRYK